MKWLFRFFVGFSSLTASAQLELPDLSPEERIIQSVGYTHFEVRYGRPAARGRKIFGELVPYGKLWRTGAGPCTTLTFDQPVIVNEKTIQPGTYALVTIPSKNQWQVLINSDTKKIYGDPSEYDVKDEVVRFSVEPVRTSRFCESLSIDLDVSQSDVVLYLSWENTQISFKIKTGTFAKVDENIKSALAKDPTNADALSLAAYYYEMNNLDLAKALDYVRKAKTIKQDWWFYRCEFDILVKMKDFSSAFSTAKDAIRFLQTTKPQEWELTIKDFEEDIKKYSMK